MTNGVLSYVRRLFKNPSITESDLYGSMGDFIQAEEQQRFCATCLGIALCKYKGLRWSVSAKKIFGRKIIVAELGKCVNRERKSRQRKMERLIRASKIPKAMKRCTFDTFITTGDPMIRTAKGLAMASVEDGASIILGGGTGVGKTHLAIAMVQEAVSRGRDALFVPVVDLLDEIRSGYDEGTADAIQEAVKEADCVALDDLGAQRSTSWVSERLFSVIDARYRLGKQTVITTNACSMSQLEKMLGERGARIVSRLTEMAQPLFIKARDFRTRKNVQQRLPVGK